MQSVKRHSFSQVIYAMVEYIKLNTSASQKVVTQFSSLYTRVKLLNIKNCFIKILPTKLAQIFSVTFTCDNVLHVLNFILS